jgi:formylmethanofuran dehydrogenase subunit E
MNPLENAYDKFPDDLKKCINFHGHLCPGLIYGFMVANQAKKLLNILRASDEEIAVISENDSCAIDALQVILGTTAGKGNLTIKNYGKNAYTVFDRNTGDAYRFSKKQHYEYKGANKKKFIALDRLISEKSAAPQEKMHHKLLKAEDLLSRKFEEIFNTKKTKISTPPFAKVEASKQCAKCGEMTMPSKMTMTRDGEFLCIPCNSSL